MSEKRLVFLGILCCMVLILCACVTLNDDPQPGRGCVNPERANNEVVVRGSKTYRCVSGEWKDDGR